MLSVSSLSLALSPRVTITLEVEINALYTENNLALLTEDNKLLELEENTTWLT